MISLKVMSIIVVSSNVYFILSRKIFRFLVGYLSTFNSNPFFVYLAQCPTGHYYNNETSTCTKCIMGEYQDEQGFSSCETCPLGTFTKTIGSKSKADCISKCLALTAIIVWSRMLHTETCLSTRKRDFNKFSFVLLTC